MISVRTFLRLLKREYKKSNGLYPLLYADVKLQTKVKDTDGNIGIIKGLDADIHNVEVEYLNGGMGLYCLDIDCDKYDPLYICI